MPNQLNNSLTLQRSTVKVGTDEYCSAISLKFSLSLSDFYFLNPQVDSSCSNLWADTSYCVKAVGDIETYSGYPTSTGATTFTRPTTSTEFMPSPVQTEPLQPTASGTLGDCYTYENAFDATSQLENLTVANSCFSWAHFANVTVEQLVEWNPSLAASNCVLQAGKSYCLQKTQTPCKPTSSSQSSRCFSVSTDNDWSLSSKCGVTIRLLRPCEPHPHSGLISPAIRL
jgi:hypothetical protein